MSRGELNRTLVLIDTSVSSCVGALKTTSGCGAADTRWVPPRRMRFRRRLAELDAVSGDLEPLEPASHFQRARDLEPAPLSSRESSEKLNPLPFGCAPLIQMAESAERSTKLVPALAGAHPGGRRTGAAAELSRDGDL